MNEQREFFDIYGRKQAKYGDPNFVCGCSITGAPRYCEEHEILLPTVSVIPPFTTHESARPCGCDMGITPRHYCEWHLTAPQSSVRPDGWTSPAGPEADYPVAIPTQSIVRKTYPVTTGVLDYFPLAIMEVARVSHCGNEQHNPGLPLHWDRAKSTDQADCLVRHLLQRGTLDTDGMRHSAKVAWRALALLQLELETEGE